MGNESDSYLGWGFVSENSVLGKEDVILVVPIEQLPNASGKLEVNPETFTVKGVDASGKHYEMKIDTNSSIKATYRSRDPNRITPPQVMKGERVELYRYANDQTYYWESLNMDLNKRVQEIVVNTYAAKPKDAVNKDTPSTPENSYSTVIDTVNGLMEFRTSMANGEKSAWTVQINGKDGVAIIKDEKGNIVQIDSVNGVIDMRNSYASHLQLDKNNINVHCNEHFKMTAGESVTIQTKRYTVECENYQHSAKTTNWDMSNITMNAELMEVNCPTIKLNGMVFVGGLSTTGAGGADGNAEINGSMTATGDITTNSTLTSLGPVNFPQGGTIKGYD